MLLAHSCLIARPSASIYGTQIAPFRVRAHGAYEHERKKKGKAEFINSIGTLQSDGGARSYTPQFHFRTMRAIAMAFSLFDFLPLLFFIGAPKSCLLYLIHFEIALFVILKSRAQSFAMQIVAFLCPPMRRRLKMIELRAAFCAIDLHCA